MPKSKDTQMTLGGGCVKPAVSALFLFRSRLLILGLLLWWEPWTTNPILAA